MSTTRVGADNPRWLSTTRVGAVAPVGADGARSSSGSHHRARRRRRVRSVLPDLSHRHARPLGDGRALGVAEVDGARYLGVRFGGRVHLLPFVGGQGTEASDELGNAACLREGVGISERGEKGGCRLVTRLLLRCGPGDRGCRSRARRVGFLIEEQALPLRQRVDEEGPAPVNPLGAGPAPGPAAPVPSGQGRLRPGCPSSGRRPARRRSTRAPPPVGGPAAPSASSPTGRPRAPGR